jgi:tetratricopeptide (TPR) repeat protein
MRVPQLPPGSPGVQSLAGQLVVFTGKLSSLSRQEARLLVRQLGGTTAEDPTVRTTLLVVGAEGFGPQSRIVDGAAIAPAEPTDPGGGGPDASGPSAAATAASLQPSLRASRAVRETSNKLRHAESLNAQQLAHIRIIGEDEFCGLVGLPTTDTLKRQYFALRDLLVRYPGLREDQLKYLVKYGVIQPVLRTNADMFFGFPDLAAIKQVHDGLAAGLPFRSVVRGFVASRQGQLALDFRLEATPAKILMLSRPQRSTATLERSGSGPVQVDPRDVATAERYFVAGSSLDDGDESTLEEAALAYRKALEVDPSLVPALINLANIHYRTGELVEAQALYERAIDLEDDFFEAHFNLGNIHHDLGRFRQAQACYEEALRLSPAYADGHFYLAVTLEKLGLPAEARPHWLAYRQLAPQGEWIELAKEFSE